MYPQTVGYGLHGDGQIVCYIQRFQSLLTMALTSSLFIVTVSAVTSMMVL